MSRIKENQELIDSLSGIKVENRGDAAIATVLMDISKSLAVIADAQKWSIKACISCKYCEEDFDDNPNGHCYNCHNMDKWEENDGL